MKWIERNIFSLLIVILSLMMFFLAFDFNNKARLVPLLVSSVMFFMAIIQIVIDSVPKWKQKQAHSTSFSNQVMKKEEKKSKEEEGEQHEKWSYILLLFSILIAFTVVLYYTSYLIAIPLFLCLFIWLVGKEKFISALSIAIGMTGFMYILFELILKSSI